MILGIDDPLFFFFSSSHTCRQVLYNFSSCAKSAWILTASQRNERMKNEEGTATGRWCQRLAVFPPAVSLLCLPPLLACFPSCLPFIYPSISLPFLSPCTVFRSPIFRLLERHFYFMPNETFKCQAATVGEGLSGEGGGKRGSWRDALLTYAYVWLSFVTILHTWWKYAQIIVCLCLYWKCSTTCCCFPHPQCHASSSSSMKKRT